MGSDRRVGPADYVAAREHVAHFFLASGVIAVEGADRSAFLQGQLTQDVRGLAPGQSLPAAGLTPKGKLLYFGTVVGEPDRFLLLIDESARERVLAHLSKYAVFQKVVVRDASEEIAHFALYGPGSDALPTPAGALRLAPRGELAGELLVPAPRRAEIESLLTAHGSFPVTEETAEVLRVEAGRPRLGRDGDDTNLPDELGLQDAVSTAKGCYVGQEVVARLRTYGRVNRRLTGFRFPQGPLPRGTVLPNPQKPGHELGRVTSSVASPRFGDIGLGFAFREVPDGAELKSAEGAGTAVVSPLPFA
jgi:folate-binding protein YgfZ